LPSRRQRRLALCGLLAPAAFTVAWVIAAALQPSYSPRHADVSVLAAAGAADPWVAIAGMALTGALLAAFAPSLRGPAWPALLAPLVALGGVSVVAVGGLRIDCSEQLSAVCRARSDAGLLSWHDRAHNVATAVALIAFIGAMLLVAVRPGGRPGLRSFSLASCAGTVALFVVYRTAVLPGWSGALERGAAYLPLLWVAALAVVALRPPRPAPPAEAAPVAPRAAPAGERR
jgi:hypothetical membrane protein